MTPNDQWIYIHGRRCPVSSVKELGTSGFTDNELAAVQFCRQWLSGQKQFYITTSGSTGPPKKLTIYREQMEGSARLTARTLGLQASATALVCLDTSYIAGMMMLVRCLETGMNAVITKPSSNPFESLPYDLKIDFAAMVPLQVKTILDSDDAERLNGIRHLIIGGAGVSRTLETRLQTIKAECYATFGMTETVSHVALQKLNGEDRSALFEALPGVTFSLDDRQCLVINATHLLVRDKTDATGVFVTNDIADLVSETSFKWLGRFDSIINTGGVKVIPEVIEAKVSLVFNRINLLTQFFITSMPDESLGQSVALVLEGKPDAQTIEQLMAELRQSLNRYEMPRRLFFSRKFAETATGKIDKRSSMAFAVE